MAHHEFVWALEIMYVTDEDDNRVHKPSEIYQCESANQSLDMMREVYREFKNKEKDFIVVMKIKSLLTGIMNYPRSFDDFAKILQAMENSTN